MRTLARKNRGRINYADARTSSRQGTNDFIQSAIRAKVKSVEILSTHEAHFGSRKITESPQTASNAKLEFGILRIDICRREI
jgi:hypothetical protein